MKKALQTLAVASLLVTACSRLNTLHQPAGLPVRYANAQCGLTISLPSNWRAFQVSVQQWQGETYLASSDRTVVIEHGPLITLRHPKWQPNAPYQHIPVLVFTRSQWDSLHQGKFWPSLYAGGFMEELWHNQRNVFAISSRYNTDDSVADWSEVAGIINCNRSAHAMAKLYPE